MFKRRARLHGFIVSVKASRHLKHAFKCSLGISLLSLPGFLPLGSPGRCLTGVFGWRTEALGQAMSGIRIRACHGQGSPF